MVVPLGGDEQLRKERLVVAALGLLVSGAVDGLHVFGQLQRQRQLLPVDGHAVLCLDQRLMGGVQFALQFGLLALEQGGRNGLLVKAHLHELVLPGFQLGNQLGLGSLDLAQGVLADFGQGADSRLAALNAGGWHLYRGVVALYSCLDQLRADIGAGRTVRAIDPAATEEVGVLAAVAPGRDSERQPSAALAAKDAAP